MKAPTRRVWLLMWGVVVVLLLTASVYLGETPLSQNLRDRLTRRSSRRALRARRWPRKRSLTR